ncbi:MAG: hypothetical protein AB7I19_16460 [Planctomycetota bacterium]
MTPKIPPRAALTTVALLIACAAPPPPAPTPPAVAPHVRHLLGSAVSGVRPHRDPADTSTEHAVLAEVEFRFAPRAIDALREDDSASEPLAPHTRALIGPRQTTPLRGVATRARGARLLRVPMSDFAGAHRFETLRLSASRAAILPETTAEIVLRSTGADFEPGTNPELGVALHQSETDGLVCMLMIGAQHDPDRELLLLDLAPKLDEPPLALALPSPFDPASTLLISIAVRSPDADPGVAQELAILLPTAREDFARARAESQEATALLSAEQARSATIRAALAHLSNTLERRRAVAFLGESAGAPLLVDLALTTNDDELSALIAALSNDTTTIVGDSSWHFESLAWRFLAEQLDRGSIDDALRGMLLRVAGEAGRFPGAVAALLTRAKSKPELDALLIEENFAMLATSDPAARVRAYDWLSARNKAPEGFDPLADRDRRRDALQAHQNALEVAPEGK